MGTNIQALIKKMKQARGYLYPEWELAARLDPEFFEAYDGLYRQALAKDSGLPIIMADTLAEAAQKAVAAWKKVSGKK